MVMEVYEGKGEVVEASWGIVDGGGITREVVTSHGMGLWAKISMGRQKFQECIK